MLNDLKKLITKFDTTDHYTRLLSRKLDQMRRICDDISQDEQRHKRSIDWIGSGIKWFAGNPDAIDLKTIYERTFGYCIRMQIF